MKKPEFRPIAPLAVDDRELERLSDSLGVPKLVRSSASRVEAKPTPSPVPSPAPRRAIDKLTLELPGYLVDAMKLEAVRSRTSVRYVVMAALAKAGYSIEAADLVPDGRRTSAT